MATLKVGLLAKVSDWNSFRINQNYSDSFRYLHPTRCESFRSNPKNQVFNPDQSESNRSRIVPNRIFNQNQSEWIQGRNDSDWIALIWIENLVSDWFGYIRIDVSELIGLSRIAFWPFFIKRDTKRFPDWFGMIRIGSDTDIGMNRNSSDWLGMNLNPILSSGALLGRLSGLTSPLMSTRFKWGQLDGFLHGDLQIKSQLYVLMINNYFSDVRVNKSTMSHFSSYFLCPCMASWVCNFLVN